jgi:hypothetical protein
VFPTTFQVDSGCFTHHRGHRRTIAETHLIQAPISRLMCLVMAIALIAEFCALVVGRLEDDDEQGDGLLRSKKFCLELREQHNTANCNIITQCCL